MIATLRTFCPDVRRGNNWAWELKCWDECHTSENRKLVLTIRSEPRSSSRMYADHNARKWAKRFGITQIEGSRRGRQPRAFGPAAVEAVASGR